MNKPLIAYLIILSLLCAGFVAGARMMGQQGVSLAGGYMLTPAIAVCSSRKTCIHVWFVWSSCLFRCSVNG